MAVYNNIFFILIRIYDKFRFMYIIASLLFILGIAAGGAYGFMVKKTAMDIIIFTIAGGFAGSAAGGLVFTYLYLTGNDEETIHDQENLSVQLLSGNPDSKDSGINSPEKQYKTSMNILIHKQTPDIKNSSDKHIEKASIFCEENKNHVFNKRQETKKTKVTTSVETNDKPEKFKQKPANMVQIPKSGFLKFIVHYVKIPKFKFSLKLPIKKQNIKISTAEPERQESNKEKIRRLKKEIKKIKDLKKTES